VIREVTLGLKLPVNLVLEQAQREGSISFDRIYLVGSHGFNYALGPINSLPLARLPIEQDYKWRGT
jgi:hypothetical protein